MKQRPSVVIFGPVLFFGNVSDFLCAQLGKFADKLSPFLYFLFVENLLQLMQAGFRISVQRGNILLLMSLVSD